MEEAYEKKWGMRQILIAILMVITGSVNTLSTKWADRIYSPGSDGITTKFDHPYLQATAMFFGEMLCFFTFKLLYFYEKRRTGELEDILPLSRPTETTNFNPVIFWPPALLDMLGTSTMYVGLNLTYASSFQMLRGAVIVFTGLLSVAFLHKKLHLVLWLGIFIIIAGLTTVGASDFILNDSEGTSLKNNIITGDLLILIAQVIVSCQMVYEEKYITKYQVPALQAVGWEGIFGFCTLSVLLIPMYFIPVGPPFSSNPRGVLEDAYDGFVQLYNSTALTFAFIGTIISIAFFNFAGVSITKDLSATTRMVLDSVRTLIIWLVSLGLRWQKFNFLQIIGFVLLVLGMCIYNRIIGVPCISKLGWGSGGENAVLSQPPDAEFQPNQPLISSDEEQEDA